MFRIGSTAPSLFLTPMIRRPHGPLDRRPKLELYLISMMETQQNSDPELARVRTATLEDLPGIVRLMNSIFGPQKQNEEVFTRWIEDGRFSVGVALSSKEEIIGVSTWYTKPAQELTNFEVFGSSAMEFIKDKLAASVLNLAIHPDHRKQGLA